MCLGRSAKSVAILVAVPRLTAEGLLAHGQLFFDRGQLHLRTVANFTAVPRALTGPLLSGCRHESLSTVSKLPTINHRHLEAIEVSLVSKPEVQKGPMPEGLDEECTKRHKCARTILGALGRWEK